VVSTQDGRDFGFNFPKDLEWTRYKGEGYNSNLKMEYDAKTYIALCEARIIKPERNLREVHTAGKLGPDEMSTVMDLD